MNPNLGRQTGRHTQTERGAHGYALRIAAETFIFWRPHGTAPHSEAALRSRATAFVAAVNGGTFAALWQPFVASAATRRPCPTDGAPAATTALPLEAIEEEAEARTPPPTDCELGSSERTARRGDGTVQMFHLIQNWHHCVPSNITISDDECNMYGECDREDCLGWLREFCPKLLPCVRFFYGSLPRIWMGGSTVPIIKTPIWIFADGARVPRAPNETAPVGAKPSYTSRLADETSVRLPHELDGHMRSCTGGMMGCPLSTLLCVGAHHRMLCEVQRRHPAVNITGTADDTYFNGNERVHAAYECKRTHAWETMRLTSKLTKVSV